MVTFGGIIVNLILFCVLKTKLIEIKRDFEIPGKSKNKSTHLNFLKLTQLK